MSKHVESVSSVCLKILLNSPRDFYDKIECLKMASKIAAAKLQIKWDILIQIQILKIRPLRAQFHRLQLLRKMIIIFVIWPKFHRWCNFLPQFYPAVMMFEEVQLSLTLRRQKRIYITFYSYLRKRHGKTCFALQVKRPSCIPTDRTVTDIVM
jgi:hypothetical protein